MIEHGFRIHATGIAGLEAVSALSSHVFARHAHDEYGIGVLVSGAQISASGRGQVTAEPGDVITVNPGEVHDGAPCGHGPRGWHMLYIAPKLMAHCAKAADLHGEAEFLAPVFRRPEVNEQLVNLHGLVRSGDIAENAWAEEHLLSLIATVLAPAKIARPAPQPGGLRKLLAEIDDAPDLPHDLATLAEAAGLSRFQVIRAFSRATGFTPHAYVVERRIRQAKRLIRTDDSLADIAARCGFTDQAHMTRLFRKRYGLTPAAYRTGARAKSQTRNR